MSREYARVKVSIWADTDFRQLSWSAQALYFQLLTSPTLNLAGVADWRPNRLAPLTAGVTVEDLEDAAAELAERGYVVVDPETEEILIRSFIRHDGVMKSPNIAAAMAKDYAAVASAAIRRSIIFELRRIHDEEPDASSWAKAKSLLTEPFQDPREITPPKSSRKGISNSTRKGSDKSSVNGSPIPHPASLNQQPSSPPTEEAAQKRGATGTRITRDWTPDPLVRSSMAQERPDVDIDTEHAKFIDYWWSKSGKDATKLDWNATWRNWIRSARGKQNGQSTLRPVPAYVSPPERPLPVNL